MTNSAVVPQEGSSRPEAGADDVGELTRSDAPGPPPRRALLRGPWSGLLLAAPGAMLLVVLTAWGLDRDPWLDEALSVAATGQLAETLDQTAFTMATYYAQLDAWTTAGGTELWWVRSLSVLHAVLAVAVAGVLAARAYGRRVAFFAALFMGGSWMVVRYGHEARSFAFMMLLVSLGWLATDHLVEDPRHRGWIACHVVVGILAPLTHGMAPFALGWQAFALAVSGAGRRTWYATVPGWAATVVGAGILYQIGGSELGTAATGTDLLFVEDFLRRFHGGAFTHGLPFHPWWLVFAATLHGSAVGIRRWMSAPRGLPRFRAAMAPAWGLGTIIGILVLNVVRPGVHVRYAVGAAPGLAILWALSSEEVRRWLVDRGAAPLRLLGRVTPVALVVLAVLWQGQWSYHTNISNSWTRLTAHIAEEARPGDGVAVPSVERTTFDVAWQRVEDPPEIAPVGDDLPPGEVVRFGTHLSPADISWQAAFSKRVWVIERLAGTRHVDFPNFVTTHLAPLGFTEEGSWEYGESRLHLFVNPRQLSGELLPE